MTLNSSGSIQKISPPRVTILLVSAAALAYEILLMRLFSIVQYHHFAYMIISMALLGYGASGTFLVFFRPRLLPHFPRVIIANILLFGITAVACYLSGQHLLFSPDEFFWDNRQWLKLFGLYLSLALPFFFAANCIALAFSRYRQEIARIYGADLFGAGLGSVFIISLLFFLLPHHALLLLGAMITAIGAVAWLELRLRPRWPALLFIVAAFVFLLLPSRWTSLATSPYKGLSQQMRIDGSRKVVELSSPLAMLTVVENERIPFRYVPGLSLAAESEPPAQLGLFTDGDSLSVITRFPDDVSRLDYLDMLTSALPYHLQQVQNILILGAGTGTDILQGFYFAVPDITAVELNAQVVQLVRERPEFSGNIYDRSGVNLHISEARSYVSGSPGKFDLIQLPIFASYNSSAAGFHALHENYLYTVEAFKEYINHLTVPGFLCMNLWVKLPPRDSIKLFATAVNALKGLGIENPGNHLVMIRSWQTASLLVKKTPFGGEEISRVKEFSRRRLFDLVYYPGMQEQEANRFNILQQPYFYNAAAALLGKESHRFSRMYKFNIRPGTDDKPYFAHFFKWKTLPEILKLKGQGGMVLLESGYLILVLTLLQAIAASLVLILLPVALRPGRHGGPTWNRYRVGMYFFAIGLGFLFLEIAFIQKFILYLGHPLYAAAVVLAVFLVFAGMGSHFGQKRNIRVIWPVATILCLGMLDLMLSNLMLARLNWLPAFVKVTVAVLMLGPLAFSMGMPFPLALTGLGAKAPDLIPWAWAVNGCASVVAAVLATLLAVHFGFALVVLAALMLYGLAAAAFPSGQNAASGS